MGKNCKIRRGAGEKRVPDGRKKAQNGKVGREKVPKTPIGAEKSNVSHVGPRAKRGARLRTKVVVTEKQREISERYPSRKLGGGGGSPKY